MCGIPQVTSKIINRLLWLFYTGWTVNATIITGAAVTFVEYLF